MLCPYLKYQGVLTTYRPPKTMKITITAGAIATADSADAAREPTLIPRAVLAIDSYTCSE